MVHERGAYVLAITITLTTIAALLVALRLYIRFFYLRNAGREDAFITLAMGFSIALTVLIGQQVKYGMGQHIKDLSQEDIFASLKPFWGSIWVYYLSLTFTKISILSQYMRLFPGRPFQIAAWSVFAVIVAYGIFTFFNSIFLCYPVAFFWDKTIPGGKCINQFVIWFTNAGLNIATDFAVIILPMPVLAGLKMPRAQKRLLMGVFALGGFVCVVSILRLQSLVAISNSSDPTYDNPPAATWSSVESTVGIICACLPSLRPILAPLFPSLFMTTGSSRTRPTRGSVPLSNTYGQSRKSYVQRTLASRKSHVDFDTISGETELVKDTEMFAMSPVEKVTIQGNAGSSSDGSRSSHSSDDARRLKEISVTTVIEQEITEEQRPHAM